MAKRISEWMRQVSTGPVTLLALAVFVAFSAWVLPQQAARAAEAAGGAGTPDMSLFYSPGDLYRWAEAYGASGRQAYVRARFTFDLVFPLVYLFFLATATSWVSGRVFPPDSLWQRANLAPLLGTLFDYSENVSAALVMVRYPERTPVVDLLAPAFTALKWLALGASFVFLAVALAMAARSWARERSWR
jgi:hypothetical protein